MYAVSVCKAPSSTFGLSQSGLSCQQIGQKPHAIPAALAVRLQGWSWHWQGTPPASSGTTGTSADDWPHFHESCRPHSSAAGWSWAPRS